MTVIVTMNTIAMKFIQTIAEKVADIATSSSQSGYVMGEILANALDAPCDYDTPPSIEMTVNGQLLTYVQYINKQVLEINSKKFFRLTNWETPLLFGYKHFAGIYNSIDKRGYIGYCQLVKCTMPVMEIYFQCCTMYCMNVCLRLNLAIAFI